MTHSFTLKIPGEYKNPLPKLKMTGRQHWMPKAQLYAEYKQFVIGEFLDSLPDIPWRKDCEANSLDGKPIVIPKGKKARMDIFIVWATDARGDGENIFGAVADALFHNDKMLAGSFDFDPKPRGEASVIINIEI